MVDGSISTKRWIYLDISKILAVFGIVLMHVTAGAWGISEIGRPEWYALTVYNVLSRFCMPLFFMQIGALMLNSEVELSVKTLYRRQLLHLVTAFLFWSVIHMIIYYGQQAPGGFSDFTLGGFVVGVLEGAPHVHWFIFVSMALYIAVPILRAIARDEKICGYALIIWFIFSVLMPNIRQYTYDFPNMPNGLMQVLTQTVNAADRISPPIILQFMGYMLLGHYIHVHEFSKKQSDGIIAAGALSLVFTTFMTIFICRRDGAAIETYFGNFTPNIVLYGAAAMVATKRFFADKWIGDRIYRNIRFFSDVAFGIFLVHDVLRLQLSRLNIHTTSFTPFLSVPLFSVGIFIVSALVAYGLKKIPGIGKYIV